MIRNQIENIKKDSGRETREQHRRERKQETEGEKDNNEK